VCIAAVASFSELDPTPSRVVEVYDYMMREQVGPTLREIGFKGTLRTFKYGRDGRFGSVTWQKNGKAAYAQIMLFTGNVNYIADGGRIAELMPVPTADTWWESVAVSRPANWLPPLSMSSVATWSRRSKPRLMIPKIRRLMTRGSTSSAAEYPTLAEPTRPRGFSCRPARARTERSPIGSPAPNPETGTTPLTSWRPMRETTRGPYRRCLTGSNMTPARTSANWSPPECCQCWPATRAL
jgi:hypothetical protein